VLDSAGLRSLLVIAVALVAMGGCDIFKPPAPKAFDARLKVFGDPGEPLAGADVFYKQRKIGTTDAAGTVSFRLKGAEGEVYDLMVKCPSGYTSPTKPVHIVLRKSADPKQRAEYQADCPKSTRSVVVAVRADAGPNLPVLYLGREVAKTDASGAAHVLLDVAPHQTFQLQLSTDGSDAKDLRPPNPTSVFEVTDEDAVFVFHQEFKVEKKRVVRGPAPPSGPKPL
jgi:hypothetical protein